MELIDTHCHLQFEKLAVNLPGVIKNAKEAGVNKLVCIGTSLADSQKAVELAARHADIWASVGVHPHDAKNFFEEKGAAKKLADLYKMPKVVAVGEIGLDFYKNYSPKHQQEKLLQLQLELGQPTGLPFIFHVRDAWGDFWRIFDRYKNLRGVIHSFSAGPSELDEALSRGLYVALNGIMTFTNDEKQLAAVGRVPKNRLVLETDAPFLTPSSQRGKVCEPAFVRDVAKFLADRRDESLEELAAYTTKNAQELFEI